MWPNTQRKYSAKAAIDQAIHQAIQVARTDSRNRESFEHLLQHVLTRTPLLRPTSVGGRNDTDGIRQIVGGLLAMASNDEDWLRSVEDWIPIGERSLPVFRSLVLHLFAKYPVPAFMTSVTRIWTIRELLSSGELFREGLAMQHCVASYVRACAGRTSSIWSIRFDDQVRRRRVMTIEVDLKGRVICQARRQRNARPSGKAREILERWARHERLTIAEYL
jgi:PcfJ-like protein